MQPWSRILKLGVAAIVALLAVPPLGAEEKVSPILTALSSTTISGYVHTSAHWDLGAGNRIPSIPPARVHLMAIDAVGLEQRSASDRLRTATFVIGRTGPLDLPLEIRLAWGGTAVNGVDYEPVDSHVVIPAGERYATIVIRPLDDAQRERLESVQLRLLPAAGYYLRRSAPALAVIRDND